MLIYDAAEYSAENIKLHKSSGGEDVSPYGAFAVNELVTLCLTADRRAGVCSPVLEFTDDDSGASFEIVPSLRSDGITDVYTFALPTERDALYFYKIKYKGCSGERYIKNDYDGSDIFQLTVYDKKYETPDWFCGGTMYHIFVDRFFRGGNEPCRDGAYMASSPDDCPQYAEKNGGELSNNMFFGGDIPGVTAKLDYLASLGVTCIYLSPIFEAASNHKYDTGDYMKIDSMFGNETDIRNLLKGAHARGIRIILDGVFNHTGDDSRYFNRYGHYDSVGAYQSEKSEYADWYRFHGVRDSYDSWWGIKILPTTNKDSASFRDFIFGENGVVPHYLKLGTDGWRLDVADELPESFLTPLTASAKAAKKDCIVIGEVWEDASNKTAYSVRRRYFRSGELDSVMNYPWRNAVIDFVKNGGGDRFKNAVMSLYGHYPKRVSDCLMNFLGTHDTERILTLLGGKSSEGMSNDERARTRMSEAERQNALILLRLAYTLTATLPGVPCIYYGDEAGAEGYSDPFNRRFFPWKSRDTSLTDFYRRIGAIRRENSDFAHAAISFTDIGENHVVFTRGKILIAVNRGSTPVRGVIPTGLTDMISGEQTDGNIPALRAYICRI